MPGSHSALVNDSQFHLRDLLVNALYEFKNEIDKLLLLVLLQVVLGDQERKVVLFWVCALFPEDLEAICSQCEEPLKHVRQEYLHHLVLLDRERYSARVH